MVVNGGCVGWLALRIVHSWLGSPEPPMIQILYDIVICNIMIRVVTQTQMMMILILQQKYEEAKEKGEEGGKDNVTEVIHSDNCIIIDCCMYYLLLCVVSNYTKLYCYYFWMPYK